MLHLGDITKINGHHVPTTDCVIFGAPCQDLSVAGKRAGMKHSDLGDEETTRSGLFMEAVRIIKEMRETDVHIGRSGHDIRPRYGIYENVPGALSSNLGQDFRVVLEELARVVEEGVTIPRPPKGKWATTGVIIGDGWSLAWRVFDAQYWGVPQRRRRICIVVDFNGHTAPQIVFSEGEHHGSSERGACKPSLGYLGEKPRSEVQSVSEGLSRNLESSQPQRKEVAPDASRGLGGDDTKCLFNAVIQPVYSVENPPADSRVDIDESGKVQTLTSRMGTGGGNVPMVMQCYSKSKRAQSNTDYETWNESETANTLNSFDVGDVRTTEAIVSCETIALEGNGQRPSHKGDGYAVTDKSYTLNATEVHGVAYKEPADMVLMEAYQHHGSLQSNSAHSLNGNNVVRVKYIVRRLTPLECERLQGFPDGWTDIGEYIDTNGKKKQSSDAARYKALGNSIALPSWKFILKRLCANYERDATMASLFDGIGGFPLLWEKINGKGSCLWASEIEEFPIAVTSRRFNDE